MEVIARLIIRFIKWLVRPRFVGSIIRAELVRNGYPSSHIGEVRYMNHIVMNSTAGKKIKYTFHADVENYPHPIKVVYSHLTADKSNSYCVRICNNVKSRCK